MSVDKISLADRIKHMSPKAKQYVVLGGVSILFIGLVLASVGMLDDQSPMIPVTTAEQGTTKNITAPGAQVDPKDVWMAQSSQDIKEISSLMLEMKQKLNDVERKQATPDATPENLIPALPPLPPFPKSDETSLPPLGATPTLPEGGNIEPVKKEPGIASFEISEAPPIVDESAQSNSKNKSYIPSGSFMRVALLGGLDAPTGGQAQTNPWPVLMRVQDNAFLPNKYRAKVKECFVLGAGYGDISSERANIKIESFSCVLQDGEAIDVPAKGYVVGEDGKAGMRGRLVTKQGQVLANALTMGILSGIGQGFQQSSMLYSRTAFGSVGEVDPAKQYTAGIGAGVGKALDRLSQYYITLAEKMFPIIEVDAGRTVDIVLTKGLTLGFSSAGTEDEYSEIWKRGRQIQQKPLNPLE